MKLEIYTREDGKFAWRLKADNNRIIATDGGQGYERRSHCISGAMLTTNYYMRVNDGTYVVSRDDIQFVENGRPLALSDPNEKPLGSVEPGVWEYRPPAEEPAELCMICGKTGSIDFECEHPDAHTPLATSYQDANGEPIEEDGYDGHRGPHGEWLI